MASGVPELVFTAGDRKLVTRTAPRQKTLEAVEAIEMLDDRLRWLSAWMIHHANHLRESRDGLKVGGHQAGTVRNFVCGRAVKH